MDWFFENFGALLNAATAVVGASAAITALTPTPKDDGVVRTIRQILDLLALNVGHARNR